MQLTLFLIRCLSRARLRHLIADIVESAELQFWNRGCLTLRSFISTVKLSAHLRDNMRARSCG